MSHFQQAGPELSEHASDMLKERKIQEGWVKLVIENPEREEIKEDRTVHYVRAIEEYGGRYLRVVVNPDYKPRRIITVFFDRRMMRRSQ